MSSGSSFLWSGFCSTVMHRRNAVRQHKSLNKYQCSHPAEMNMNIQPRSSSLILWEITKSPKAISTLCSIHTFSWAGFAVCGFFMCFMSWSRDDPRLLVVWRVLERVHTRARTHVHMHTCVSFELYYPASFGVNVINPVWNSESLNPLTKTSL